MAWDFSDVFKGLMATAISAFTIWAYKKLKPTVRLIKRFWNIANQTDILQKDVAILQNERLALFHIDLNPILIKNTKGEIDYCNPAFVDMAGFNSAEDAYGFGFTEAIHPDERERTDRLRAQQQAHPSQVQGIVKMQNIQTQQPILVHFKTKPIYYKGDLVETLIRLYIISE